MTHFRHDAHRTLLQRRLAILAAALLIALDGVALAQEARPAQIPFTEAQIRRSGIETELVVSAGDAAGKGGTAAADGQHLSGTVVAPPSTIAIVSTAVGGIVQQVLVTTLQTVEPDTPVIRLFSQPLMEAQRDYLHLAIQARLAQEKMARDEQLFNEGIIPRSRLQETRGAAMQADLAARERHQALRAAGMSEQAIRQIASRSSLAPQLTILAGARGTLVALDVHAGQRIDAGMPIASISTGAALWIELQASRQQAAQIRVGDLLQIRDCGPARVIALSPQVDPSNQSTVVRAQLLSNHTCLKPNQFVEASHGGARVAPGSLGVPAAAVVHIGDGAFVFRRNGQGFEAVKVSVLSGGLDRVWVRAPQGNLAAGAAVAVKGIMALKGSWLGFGAEAAAPGVKPDAKPAGAK
jgi:biotin carboxyl carrier protein